MQGAVAARPAHRRECRHRGADWRLVSRASQGDLEGGRLAGWLDTGRGEGEGSGDKGTKRTKDKGRLEERYGQAALSERLLVDPEVVK